MSLFQRNMEKWFDQFKAYRVVVWSFLAWIAISDWTNIISLLAVIVFILIFAIIVGMVTMKDASVSFNELMFHMFMAVFSFFTNLSFRFPNIEEVVTTNGHSECFFPEINALQHLGILLVTHDKDGGHFLLCMVSILSAWVAFTGIRLNKSDSNDNETFSSEIRSGFVPRFMIIMSIILSFLSIYFCVSSVLSFGLVILSSVLQLTEVFEYLLNYSKRIEFFSLDTYGEDLFLASCVFIEVTTFIAALTCINNNRRFILLIPLCFESWKHLVKIYRAEMNVIQKRNNLFKNTRLCSRTDLLKNTDPCPVCLQSMTSARMTSCGHLFHSKCLGLCLQQNSFCPLCRTDLKIDTFVNS